MGEFETLKILIFKSEGFIFRKNISLWNITGEVVFFIESYLQM